MSRWYSTTFRAATGEEITIRSSGNTRTSAERTSRGKLKRDHKKDVAAWRVLHTVFSKDPP